MVEARHDKAAETAEGHILRLRHPALSVPAGLLHSRRLVILIHKLARSRKELIDFIDRGKACGRAWTAVRPLGRTHIDCKSLRCSEVCIFHHHPDLILPFLTACENIVRLSSCLHLRAVHIPGIDSIKGITHIQYADECPAAEGDIVLSLKESPGKIHLVRRLDTHGKLHRIAAVLIDSLQAQDVVPGLIPDKSVNRLCRDLAAVHAPCIGCLQRRCHSRPQLKGRTLQYHKAVLSPGQAYRRRCKPQHIYPELHTGRTAIIGDSQHYIVPSALLPHELQHGSIAEFLSAFESPGVLRIPGIGISRGNGNCPAGLDRIHAALIVQSDARSRRSNLLPTREKHRPSHHGHNQNINPAHIRSYSNLTATSS